jgi:hypothetical protein
MWAPVCGFIVFSIIVLVGSAMHVVHYLAVIPSTRHRIVGIPAILACVIGCAGFPGLVLWTLTGAATHITSVAIILAVIFSTAYPSAAPFTIRFLARSLAYRSLRRNQRAAARIAKSARGRLA